MNRYSDELLSRALVNLNAAWTIRTDLEQRPQSVIYGSICIKIRCLDGIDVIYNGIMTVLCTTKFGLFTADKNY